MVIEEWFDKYQYEVDYDIGESGVKFFKLGSLNIDLSEVELRYGHHTGKPGLREVIAQQYENLNASNIAVTTGAAEAIFAIIASLIGPNDHIIVEHPNYPSLYYIPESLERQMDLFHLKMDEKFKPNLEELESLIRPETKLIALTHPNNPTGSMITEKMLKEIIDVVENRKIYLLLDETYRELTYDKPLPPAATLSPRAISISTMSKAYGLPGIRIGWSATTDKKIIENVCTVREQLTICNCAISEEIAKVVLERKDEILKDIKRQVESNYKIVEEWMKSQDYLVWIAPEGGVVCFPKIKMDTSTDELCRLLVEKYRTFVIPGYCFEMNRHFRLGFGGETEELKKGLNCLEKALIEIKGKLSK